MTDIDLSVDRAMRRMQEQLADTATEAPTPATPPPAIRPSLDDVGAEVFRGLASGGGASTVGWC